MRLTTTKIADIYFNSILFAMYLSYVLDKTTFDLKDMKL